MTTAQLQPAESSQPVQAELTPPLFAMTNHQHTCNTHLLLLPPLM